MLKAKTKPKKKPKKRTYHRKKVRKQTPPVPPPPTEPPAPPAEPDPEDTLTPLERRFVLNYLVDENGMRAYRELVPGCAYQTACNMARKWLARADIQRAIAAAGQIYMKKFEVNAEDAIQEVLRIAFSDLFYLTDVDGFLLGPREIPTHARRAIQSIKASRERTIVRNKAVKVTEKILEYKMYSKLDALDRVCTMLGLKTTIPDLETVLKLLPRPVEVRLRTMIVEAQRSKELENKAPAPAEASNPPSGSDHEGARAEASNPPKTEESAPLAEGNLSADSRSHASTSVVDNGSAPAGESK